MIGMAYEAKGDLPNAKQYYRRTMESNVHNLQAAIARPHARAKLAGERSEIAWEIAIHPNPAN